MTESNKAIKAGKKPVSQRKSPQYLREDDLFGNMLVIDPILQKELEDQNLEGRFVDAQQLFSAGGYHPKGWTVYKRKGASDTMGSGFRFGNDPDGVVRRGTLLLAVKSKEEAEKHREFLRQKAQRYTTVVKRNADELRQTAKENNVDTFVDENYDDK